jgi:GDP-L-fucose synthase
MWGTGAPQRDFVYAGDVARCLPFFIESYDSSEPVNISTGTSVSIRELAETIAKLVAFKGRIEWDASKPDGQLVKIFDTRRLNSLGCSCETSLEAGLQRTIAWLSKNYDGASDGLRL